MRPAVVTRHGAVRGITGRHGTTGFKNIPYASSPTGPLRFASPRPPAAWNGKRADAYGPTAPKHPFAPPLDRLIPEADPHLP
ncbi:carboxylesterase family protein [Streptomyces sp. SLBN-118]|uniref:carboxylesterase family protein n=1 Tax=Streptomyces sp. SLBN-118 TaxID=2768454 RepID=UPI001150F51F|nr:carboxylesterase family protein [Streptomyces sp. SLBN-118]TQK50059.1 carboxylesterase family protein [Streptomyces sp. SLBN-118]